MSDFAMGQAVAKRTENERVIEGDGYTIYNQSCIRMPQLEDRSVSLVLTDPPYFIDGMDDGWDNEKLHKRVKKGVIGGLPMGQKFDASQGIRLQKFLSKVGEECMRVLKPGGFMLCFGQPRLIHHTAMALENVSFEVRDIIAWQYEGQPKAFSQTHFVKKMNISEAEKASILKELGNRKTPQLKPRMELIVLAQKPKEGTFVNNWLEYGTGLVNVADPLIEPNKFPSTIIPCPKTREKYNHMAVKPLDIIRHLIRIFSKEGDLVLDPFIGTGTTAVGALQENRQCIGYEIDKNMLPTISIRLDGIQLNS